MKRKFSLPRRLLLSLLSGGNGDAVSVGIIGGADGPTSILVSDDSVHTLQTFAVSFLAVVSAIAAAFLIRKKCSFESIP